LNRLFRYLRPFAITAAAAMAVVFLQCMSDLFLPTLMSDIVNKGITNGDIPFIVRTGALMLLVAMGGSICAVAASYLSSRAAMGMGALLRDDIFRHVSGFSLHEFDRIGTPSLVTRTTNDVTQVQMVVLLMMRMMVSAPIMMIGGIIMALSKDPGLSLVIVAVIPVLTLVITIVASKGFPLFKSIQDKIDRINLVLREGLTGIRVIRAFNRIEDEKGRFDEANLDLMRVSVQVNRLFAVLMPVMMFLMNFTTIAIIWFGSARVARGSSNIGNMMAFLQYAMQILFSLLMASFMFMMLPRAQASAVRINEVLDMVPEISDPVTAKSPEPGKRGSVEFRNVSFSYHGAEVPALREISFSALPGEVTAVIGSTGSGKSTLISLIPRFYDVDSGQILVDGVDVREMTQEELRSRIGLVPQKAVLFSGTVAQNIGYGCDGSCADDVLEAADTAQAAGFIAQMKEGYDSAIAQGGTNVSGGQKQRLAIARALVRKPEIYLFDDSFSALDFKTDALLRAALRVKTADATVLIVGQRVATVMDADRIIVLDEGRIVGMGTHRELYSTCEVYKEIVDSQLSAQEIA